MAKIYKYPLEINGETSVALPNGYEILHVGLDPQGDPGVWALVDPERSALPVPIYILGTGHPMNPKATKHLGSFVHGPYVWHAFLG
jgi:hypothetical protein